MIITNIEEGISIGSRHDCCSMHDSINIHRSHPADGSDRIGTPFFYHTHSSSPATAAAAATAKKAATPPSKHRIVQKGRTTERERDGRGAADIWMNRRKPHDHIQCKNKKKERQQRNLFWVFFFKKSVPIPCQSGQLYADATGMRAKSKRRI